MFSRSNDPIIMEHIAADSRKLAKFQEVLQSLHMVFQVVSNGKWFKIRNA